MSDEEKRVRAFFEDFSALLEKYQITPQEATNIGVNLIQRSFVAISMEEAARRKKEAEKDA